MAVLEFRNKETEYSVRRLRLLHHDTGQELLHHLPISSDILINDPDRAVEGLVNLGLLKPLNWVVVQMFPSPDNLDIDLFAFVLIDGANDKPKYVLAI